MLRIFGLLRLTRCSFGNNDDDDDDDDVSLSKSGGNNIGVGQWEKSRS